MSVSRFALRSVLAAAPPLAILVSACSPSTESASSGHLRAAGPRFDDPNDDPRRCKPGIGTSGSPGTIAQAVALANTLPFPVTAECFTEALDRPLPIEATSSQTSVQPAACARSPRVFACSRGRRSR